MTIEQPVSIRLSKQDIAMVEDLMLHWGESRTQAIRRCIALTYSKTRLDSEKKLAKSKAKAKQPKLKIAKSKPSEGKPNLLDKLKNMYKTK